MAACRFQGEADIERSARNNQRSTLARLSRYGTQRRMPQSDVAISGIFRLRTAELLRATASSPGPQYVHCSGWPK
jgi:hypothetical protein